MGHITGQIVPLRVAPPAYPEVCHDLNTAECVALLAFRWWIAAFRRNEDPLPRIAAGLRRAGAGTAAPPIDALMSIVARSARRTMTIHAPRCPALATDEAQLLCAGALAQRGDGPRARQALRTALLSAIGAEFALGPLEGIGVLFARSRLLFRRRLPPPMAVHEGLDAWPPHLFADTLH